MLCLTIVSNVFPFFYFIYLFQFRELVTPNCKAFRIATTMPVDILARYNGEDSTLNVELSLTVAELAEQVQRVFSLTGQSIELELDGSVMPSSFGLTSFSFNANSVVNVSVTTNEIGVIIPVSTTVGFSCLHLIRKKNLWRKLN